MLSTFFALAVTLQATEAANPDLARLSWLAGCWTETTKQSVIEEQWMAPGGGIMMGMSRTVIDGRTASYEFVRIAPMLSGTLAYIAAPSGQPARTFPIKTVTDREVIFENLANDFPQRVIYRRDGAGIKARIEGVSGGRSVGQDFAYKACRQP